MFSDATVDGTNINSGILMRIPSAEYTDSRLQGYYYGQFQVSGAVTGIGWTASDKVVINVIFNITPCA